jgi:subtilisin family serine protease
VYIRFRFASDLSTNYDGWNIDDVEVTAVSHSSTLYAYYAGTSMATAHVSGLAALIWSFNPGLTHNQVRQAILSSVDTKSSLSGKTETEGRINANNALAAVDTDPPAAPSNLSAVAVSSSNIDISWTDNANNETVFVIERKQDGGVFAQLVLLGENITTYSDTGLSPSTTYYYRIKSLNLVGESGYSNEASATTSDAAGGGGGGGGGGCFISTASADTKSNPSTLLVVIALIGLGVLEKGWIIGKNQT